MKYLILPKKAWFIHAFFFLSFSISAQTSPVWIENFDYKAGDEIGSHGWVFENGNPAMTVSAGLTFGNYPGSNIGNGLQIKGDGEAARHTFTQISSGNVYTAFLVQFNENYKSQYFFTLWDGNMPAWAGGTDQTFAFNGRIYCEDNSDFDPQVNIGLSFFDNKKAVYTTDKPVTIGQTYLLVLKYEIVPGDRNDKVSLYLLDQITDQEPDKPLLGTLSDNASKGDIKPAGLMFRPSHNGQDIIVDGIRVGTTWESTVPYSSSGIKISQENPEMSVSKETNSISVKLSQNMEIKVQNTSGQIISSVQGQTGINRIPLSGQGLYIITAGKDKQKIIF